MRKIMDYIEKGNKIFIGLEDSKKTWKLCVRSDGMILDETNMPAKYDLLRTYVMNRFPDCEVTVMYEAGFQGFWLHGLLEKDGIKLLYRIGINDKVPIENLISNTEHLIKSLCKVVKEAEQNVIALKDINEKITNYERSENEG